MPSHPERVRKNYEKIVKLINCPLCGKDHDVNVGYIEQGVNQGCYYPARDEKITKDA